MLVSDPKGRDIKIDAYTLSFHGRLLFEGAQIELNYGRRCVAHEARARDMLAAINFTILAGTVCLVRTGRAK